MVQWRPLSSGASPVPQPAAAPSVWAVAGVSALVLVTALNYLNGQGDPTVDLLVLAGLAAVLSTGARLVAAPGTALVCWLILNGFATPPMGELTWAAGYDLGRFGCLLVAAVTGTAIGRLAAARAAYRSLRPYDSNGA
ncbi:hypothetical protein [Streptomyces xanthophaeus]|uniref:Integral membrane protein n=1 Tax=Streptomyces xanthophaeus TaxID=67385 RepID=A0A919LD96_9ACTN|nr:hypothetical protein [Streptomyces xanthophaeus]GHI83117.1 hypothetical protein Sxan_04810 [Streptomyces xanthophaeus]